MNSDDQHDQAQWLALAKAGDTEAFERLLRPQLPMLLAYSNAICGNHHTAEDVVQQTALIAFRRFQHFFPEADFGAWLRAIARREALAAYRKASRLTPAVEEALEQAYYDPVPESGGAELAALRKCVESLDDRSRQLVHGHYFDDGKLADVASALGVKLNTAKSLLHRARLTLQDCVARRLRLEGAQ